MIYEVKMTMVLRTKIKADDEEELMDWLNMHTPAELEYEYGVREIEYNDEIIQTFEDSDDYEISTTEDDEDD